MTPCPTGLAGSVPATKHQQVLVVGADTTAVRLVEELVRAGEQLVVLAHGQPDPDVVADLEALGATVITASPRYASATCAGPGSSRPDRWSSSVTTTSGRSGSR